MSVARWCMYSAVPSSAWMGLLCLQLIFNIPYSHLINLSVLPVYVSALCASLPDTAITSDDVLQAIIAPNKQSNHSRRSLWIFSPEWAVPFAPTRAGGTAMCIKVFARNQRKPCRCHYCDHHFHEQNRYRCAPVGFDTRTTAHRRIFLSKWILDFGLLVGRSEP